MISHILEDTVNQVGKIALGIIKNASAEIIRNQIIRQGGKEAERALPKILRGVIEDMYQTPFGKQQLNKLKYKILR